MKITPFVRLWSTMKRIESNPLLGGKLVIKSIEMFAKDLSDSGPFKGTNAGFIVDCLILNC